MKIGVIGTGNIGGYLARAFVKLGHTVSITNSRGPDSLKDFAAETGTHADTLADLVREQDVIILSIPEKAVLDLPHGLFQSASASTVIVDTGNYYPFRDGQIEQFDSQQVTESEWVAQHIGRPVIKVFNNIIYFSLSDKGVPAGQPNRIALPVAGDDAKAKQVVIGLVDALGFDGVDAGSIAESWRQQPGTPVYCADWDASGVKAALAKADRSKSAEVRDESIKKMFALPKGLQGTPPDEVIRLVRDVIAEKYGQ